MNQILSVEPPKPKKEKKQKTKKESYGGGQIEIEKIVKFFAIVLIVFGVIMVGSGSYSMYQSMQTGEEEPAQAVGCSLMTIHLPSVDGSRCAKKEEGRTGCHRGSGTSFFFYYVSEQVGGTCFLVSRPSHSQRLCSDSCSVKLAALNFGTM